MSALLHMLRSPRKLVIIVAGAASLIGSSGAFALYMGKDRLLGFVAASPNGLACRDVSLVTIRKENRFWVRKYIRTEPTDGLTRVKTALRVAKAVYAEQKPDLVQVVVLDANGPTLRSDIRGRALGADVVYVPHPEKIAGGVAEAPVTARYYNGGASAQGLFFGEQVNMLPEDIDTALAALKDYTDCDNALTAGNDARGSAKAEKLKAAVAAEEKATAQEPKEHRVPEPASTGNVPAGYDKNGEFIGADASDGKEPPSPGLDPTMTGASNRRSPVTN